MYAERCNAAHSGLKALIDECEFEELGERIYKDLELLEKLYHGRAKNGEEMRKCILRCQDEWFISIKKTGRGRIWTVLTEKALRKRARLDTVHIVIIVGIISIISVICVDNSISVSAA